MCSRDRQVVVRGQWSGRPCLSPGLVRVVCASPGLLDSSPGEEKNYLSLSVS